MSWTEQESKDRKKLEVSAERASLLDKVKKETLPTIKKEAATGDKPVEAIRFQEVKSPGNFEAEFGLQGTDVIFHFWPWGLHAAERDGRPRPPFVQGFGHSLSLIMKKHFGRADMSEDRDMGSWFVRIPGLGAKQFWFRLSVQAATELHEHLGGEPG
jgi:hypothetical protein